MNRAGLIIFMLLIAINSMAQYQITGNVRDDMKESLTNVNVLVYVMGDTVYFKGVVSDLNGNYAISDIKEGTYQIEFSMLGFSKERVTVHLKNDICLDTISMKSVSESLNEVVVNADLIKVFGNKSSVQFSLSEKAKAVSGLELVSNVPQLFLNSLNNKIQTVKGGSVLILLDGLKVNEQDLMGVRPEDVLKAEYFSQPPIRYANLGIDAVMNVITRRSKIRGGYVMANLRNGLTTGFGTNIMQVKYSNGNNDFSLRYFVDYRDLNKNRLNQSYEYTLDDGVYLINKQGENGDYVGQYHIAEGTFARVKSDDYLLSLKAKIAVAPNLENSPQKMSGIRAGNAVGDEYSRVYAQSNYLSPNIDLYYSKKFANRQELMLNVVNTYYDSKSNKTLTERFDNDVYEVYTQLNNTSYSLISEAVYIKEFDKQSLNVGTKYFYKTLQENYESSFASLTKKNNEIQNIYVYAEWLGKFDKFSYMLGLGAEQTWLQANETNKYFVLKPTLSLSYFLTSKSSFKLSSLIESHVPDISLLTNSPAYLDSAFISHGNPSLKPYYDFSNSLSYSYNTSSLYFETALSYIYSHSPYYVVFRNNGKFAEKTYANQGDVRIGQYEMFMRWNPTNWFSITPFYTLSYQQTKYAGFDYNNWYQRFSMSAMASYKDFSFNGRIIVSNKKLFGIALNKPTNYYYADVTWKKKSLSLKLACLFSGEPDIMETCKNLPVQYRESKEWGNFKGLMFVQLVYTLPFGKSIKRSSSQKLNNNDNDSGLYIDNKAKL